MIPSPLRFEFSNVHTDALLRSRWDVLLRIVGDFQIWDRNVIRYQETEFCLVEFAIALAEWLAVDEKSRADFVYSSMESETEGLVSFSRLDPNHWQVAAADQQQPFAGPLGMEDIEHAAISYVSTLREDLLPKLDILDYVETPRTRTVLYEKLG